MADVETATITTKAIAGMAVGSSISQVSFSEFLQLAGLVVAVLSAVVIIITSAKQRHQARIAMRENKRQTDELRRSNDIRERELNRKLKRI